MKWTFYIASFAVALIALYFQVFGQSVIRSSSGRSTPYKAGGLFDSSVYYIFDSGSGTLGALGQRKVEGAVKEDFQVIDIKVEFNDSVPGTTTVGKMRDQFFHDGRPIPFDPLNGNLKKIQRGPRSVHFYQTQDKIYFQDGEKYSDALSADPMTLIPSPDEKERNNFVRIGGYREYYQDRTKVFYVKENRTIIVEGADPATFQLVTGDPKVDATDRSGRYFKGEKIP